MSQSLYEITTEMMKLDAILEASGGALPEGAEGETLQALVEHYGWLERDKIDGYGEYWTSLKALATALEEEIDRLDKRRRVALNKIERLKDAARFAMDNRNRQKLEGQMFTICLQKNGGAPGIELKVPVEQLPEEFQKKTVSANMDAIRTALKERPDMVAKVAELKPVGYSIRLK